MEDKFCEPCTARGRNPTAFQWCAECEEALCSECTEAHRVQKITRNHHLVDISKIPKSINRSYNCSEHEHLPFDYFCVDHDEIGCKECMSQNHRACKNTSFIELASKDSKRSQSFIDSEEQLSLILEALENLNKSCKENDSRIKQQDTDIRKQISAIKEQIIKQLKSLEESLLQQLSETKDTNVSRLRQQEKDILDLITSSKAEKETLEFFRDHGSDKQAFVAIHSSKPIRDEIENKVKQLSESFMEISLIFVESVRKEHITDLGSIRLKKTHCSFQFVQHKQRQSQVPVVPKRKTSSFTHLYDIEMQGHSLVGVSGITILDDKRLVFCDVLASKVHVCDANDVLIYSILSPYAPWDIAAIPGTTRAVMSSRNEPYIQFIDFNRREIIKQIEVHQSEGYGIAASNDSIFVGTEKEIHVLDRNGMFKRTVPLKHGQGPIGYISYSSNGHIYYSNNDEVYCIALDGDLVFSYSSPRLRGPRKIHDVGNVYILGFYSQNIHQITSTGRFVDILLDDKIYEPNGLCFSKDVSKVYIANGYSNTMSVFKINQ